MLQILRSGDAANSPAGVFPAKTHIYFNIPRAECAADNLDTGTLKGEQLT